MKYKHESTYQVEIALADNSNDSYNLKGVDVIKLRETIFTQGYTRVDKKDKAVTHWISPFLISAVTVTEKTK